MSCMAAKRSQVVTSASYLSFPCVLFIFLILVTYVPWILTFLPSMIIGPEITIK